MGMPANIVHLMGKSKLLLDIYAGAAIAFSTSRKIRGGYSGYAFKIRRSSDNTLLDIGFDSSGNVDESAITSFVGVNSAFVHTWYDQSGNGNNLTQTTDASQPRIVNAGTIDKINGKIAFRWDGVNDSMNLASAIANTTTWSTFNVQKRDASGKMTVSLSSSGQCYTTILYTDNIYYSSGQNGYLVGPSDATAAQSLLSCVWTATARAQYKNGTLLASAFTNTSRTGSWTNVGFLSVTSAFATGYCQEFILYNADQSSVRAAIETNQRTYFNF